MNERAGLAVGNVAVSGSVCAATGESAALVNGFRYCIIAMRIANDFINEDMIAWFSRESDL